MVTRRDIIGGIAGILAARQMPAMPIGARSIAIGAKMEGTPTARDYVQNGLVYHADMIEAGGYGVSLSDGTHNSSEWISLVGNGSVSTWNGKIMVADGNFTNYATSSFKYSVNLSRAITIENYITLVNGNGFYANASGYSYIRLGTVQTKAALIPKLGPSGIAEAGKANKYHLWRLVFDGDQYYVSLDDGSNQIVFPEANIDGSPNGDAVINTSTNFGGGSGTTVNAMPYTVRVYNRVLSAEEMAHNYAVDKARFGLP